MILEVGALRCHHRMILEVADASYLSLISFLKNKFNLGAALVGGTAMRFGFGP